MGDQPTGKLTASIEDLSLKKQLPLRQQAQKPMLKYSNSSIKPVQLFNHADMVSIRSNAEAARNAYSSLSNASTSTTMSTPFRSTMRPPPSPQQMLKQATSTPPSTSTTTRTTSAKGHSNPYARPLSAKDIVSDLQGQQKIKKTPSASQMQSGPNSLFNQSGSPGTPMFGFPVNAFMRPQSALRKDDSVLKAGTKTAVTNGSASSKGTGAVKSTPRKTVPFSKLEREPDLNQTCLVPGKLEREPDLSQTGLVNGKSGNSSAQYMNQSTSKNQFGPATKSSIKASESVKEASSNSVTSSPSKVAVGSQTPNSVTAKINDGVNGIKQIPNSDGSGSKAVGYAKPVSSLPRPGSAVSTKSMSPDSALKVRNLNYTPTKPYAEVCNPSSINAAKPPISATTKTQQTSETIITVKTEPPKGTTYIAPSNISKSVNEPKSGIGSGVSSSGSSKQSSASSSGTMYYSKESKADIKIHEQRPPAIGAPAFPSRGTEKGSVTNLTSGSEIEEAGDDESEVPSGERMPGDGEASLIGDEDDDDFPEDEDDDMVDDLDDDCIGGSDGESDGYSFTSSSLSRRSSSAHKLKTRPLSGEPISYSRPQTASPDRTVKPGLSRSMFPNIPPVVTFVAEGEKVEQLPWEHRKYLKWRLSPITPNVVKHVLARSGFRITKRNHDWLGCWGKHMKSPGFKALREYQKLNHFPGSFQIGRKDRLWRNLSKMQVHFGKKEFGFFPQTYCLPTDAKLLKRAFEDGTTKQKWIIKPPASARGIGIKVINKLTQVPKKRPVVVQRYLSRPYLINDSKFDMRVYVYVSSYDPLRLYVFEDGLARFASMKYSSSMKHLANKFMHLTNYSVNKKNADYQANSDDTVCQGHKWSLKALWNYMKRQGVNTNAVWDSMKDLIIKTIICADGPVNSLIKANCKTRYCVHELFGFDILLDESLKPWILEVNISPSLHSNSQLDINIKGQMIKDLFNISGIRIPDKHDLVHNPPQTSGPPDLSSYVPPNDVCIDKRLFSQQLSADERAKHAYYCQRHQDEQVQQSILDILTPDDVRFLTESIDEDSRKGGFQRVFPTPSTYKYLKYFETPRYYNLLLNQWVQRFNRMEQRGIGLLQSLCEEGLHLDLCTENHNHQWNPPHATCHSYRGERLLSAPVSKHGKEVEGMKTSSSSSNLHKSTSVKRAGGLAAGQKPAPFSRSPSQSSSKTSSVNNLVFSPQPIDILSPKGKAPSSEAPATYSFEDNCLKPPLTPQKSR
ncbi:tubulin monoglutamylase TTLL4-like isoform X2 [Mya arenaria]|uniref:tubulin monoglutamylase TTLL4-like isoform X2 n=1 Tax=Mya arenaria TaxID=6604 RepID=UPI0022E63F04|nr:tubulin monoglutamylase TTLL4-like isoform X2 [Mya arenaria]